MGGVEIDPDLGPEDLKIAGQVKVNLQIMLCEIVSFFYPHCVQTTTSRGWITSAHQSRQSPVLAQKGLEAHPSQQPLTQGGLGISAPGVPTQ